MSLYSEFYLGNYNLRKFRTFCVLISCNAGMCECAARLFKGGRSLAAYSSGAAFGAHNTMDAIAFQTESYRIHRIV